jgi:hypothetical protein
VRRRAGSGCTLLLAEDKVHRPAIAVEILAVDCHLRRFVVLVSWLILPPRSPNRYHAEKEKAMIELTETQRQELSQPEPVAIDPQTGQKYVLVREDLYQRLRPLIPEDMPSREEVALLIEQTMCEDDAHDPLLESYQKYLEKP